MERNHKAHPILEIDNEKFRVYDSASHTVLSFLCGYIFQPRLLVLILLMAYPWAFLKVQSLIYNEKETLPTLHLVLSEAVSRCWASADDRLLRGVSLFWRFLPCPSPAFLFAAGGCKLLLTLLCRPVLTKTPTFSHPSPSPSRVVSTRRLSASCCVRF